ncbi:hypothetical protein AAVH_19811 [Aphelenchoides avenae]|nr:hypothetical protein AAVH_19811 [Aphelenchus avenae]
MLSSTVFGALFFLPALAFDNELDPVLERVRKMNIQEIFEEIDREGGRGVLTLGILPLLQRTEKVEQLLERKEEVASIFGRFGRTVVYLAAFYLTGPEEIGPYDRKELESAFEEFKMWLQSMSRRGLTFYDAGEEPPTYVDQSIDPSTEDLREVLRLIFHKSSESSNESIAGGELGALVTAPTRLLAVLRFLPADPEPITVENLVRAMRYAIAVFRLFFRHANRMHFEEAEWELVVEYIHVTFRHTMKAENWKPVAEALGRIKEWKLSKDRQEL